MDDRDGADGVLADAVQRDGQDPVRSLHDTQEGAGSEAGLADTYLMDTREADELRVSLDSASGDEAMLD